MQAPDRTPLVILFAHPDDEIGVFPWLEQALIDGREIRCIWVTDGGWGGQDTARRQRECKGVLLGMGLTEDSLDFLGERHGIRDGELFSMVALARNALGEALDRFAHGAQWLIPAWEGGHQDHDSLHLLALELARNSNAHLYQYPLYNGAGLRGPFFRMLHHLDRNGEKLVIRTSFRQRLRYVSACLTYRSQWKSFVGLLPFYALAMLRGQPFAVQPVDPLQANQRPHPGKVLYERRGGPSWDQVTRTAARAPSEPE
jgi:LmbE family N-acetylglucosaminyl deacetylase